jgi:hypothetical protein
MDRAFYIFRIAIIAAVLTGMAVAGCNYPFTKEATPEAKILPVSLTPTTAPTEKPSAEPTAQSHVVIPVTGSGKAQVIHDQVNKSYASQKRAYGGDEYRWGRFERPFSKQMDYLGYLDIVKVTMTREDPNFIYVSIQVADPVVPAVAAPAYFGLELDLNLDGRSTYLIRGPRPFTEDWTAEGMDVWKSSTSDLPLSQLMPGIPVTGTAGFDLSMLLSGKGEDVDLAWIRLQPGSQDTVEIAFKNSLVGGAKGRFVWRPFTDGVPYQPNLYDLQNSFSLEQAGSPIIGEKFYPLKEVYAVDNTCRVASGYEATGKEPGICPLPILPDKPDQPGPGGPTDEPPMI